MALTGDRFRESDVPAISTLGRRRSARAPPAEPFMGGMARRPDGTPSEDRDHLTSARPTHTFLGAREDFFVYGWFTVVKPTLSRHFPGRGGLVGGHAGPIENGAPEALPLVNLIPWSS